MRVWQPTSSGDEAARTHAAGRFRRILDRGFPAHPQSISKHLILNLFFPIFRGEIAALTPYIRFSNQFAPIRV
jgi:hypothetical protein